MKLFDDPKPDGDPDALITIVSPPTAFEAGAIVVQLEHEGVLAHYFPAADLGIAFNHATAGIPVQVCRSDFARARQVLQSQADEPAPTPTPPRAMPLVARIALIVAVAIVLLSAIGFVAVLLT